MQNPFISVIIPVFNGEKFIGRCLDGLNDSDYENLEIIVVNDGSTDDSAKICQLKGAKVLTSSHPQSGPAAARNLAAEKSVGEILVFVDADVVVKKDTISKIAERFKAQPEISALFGSYDNAPAEPGFLSQYRNLLHHFVHQNSAPQASTFWAGLGAIRANVFRKIGGFDAVKFAVPSIEDIELGVRLKTQGCQILLDREIQGKHLKKWTAHSILRTDIFCRALPWSKLILTSQGLINDMNLKTSDRLSALLVGLSVLLFPFIFRQPLLTVLLVAFLLSVLILNRQIFSFFLKNRGFIFAFKAFWWHLLYFFYSGCVFVFSWFRYGLPQILGIGKQELVKEIRRTN